MAWLFDRGAWKEIDDPANYGPDGERAEIHDAMESAGYEKNASEVGLQWSLKVWERDQKRTVASYPYRVVLDMGSGHTPIYCTDYPSLLMLLRDLAPIVSCGIQDLEEQDRLDSREDDR